MSLPDSADAYVDGVLRRDTAVLAQTITLLESKNLQHRVVAQQVLEQLLAHSG